MSVNNPFAAPAAASGGLDLKTNIGRLLIIEPTSVEDGIQTSYGATSAVRANVTVVDTPNGAEVHEDTLIFPRVLQSQLKTRIGQKVLGRLGQGQAKPGQSAPWIIQDPTEGDIQAGVTYLNQQAASGFQAPATGSTGAAAATPPF